MILITGATGNVGNGLITYLSTHKIPFKAAIPEIPGEWEKLDTNISKVSFDFTKTDTYESALVDVTKIFLMRPPSLTDIKHDMLPFLKFAKSKGVEYIVVLSLMGVNPLTPHYKMEKYIQKLGFKYTFLRPSFFMQNLSTTHAQVIRDEHDILVPAGKSRTSFIDANDIGEAAGILLNTFPHSYVNKPVILTGPEALNYYEIAEILSEILNTTITYSNPSRRNFKKYMIAHGFKPEYVKVMANLYFITRLGNAKKVTATLPHILGHSPTSFREFACKQKFIWQ